MSRQIEYMSLDDLIENPSNPKKHDTDTIDSSIGRFGYLEPLVRDDRTGQLISGHGRLETLRRMQGRGDSPPEGVTAGDNEWHVPVLTGWASRSDQEADAALVAMNRTTELGGWDDQSLASMLDELATVDGGLDGVGFDQSDLDDLNKQLHQIGDLGGQASRGGLLEEFVEPPFSVLDGRSSRWQTRKRAWIDLGIESEVGRGEQLVFDSGINLYGNWYVVKKKAEAEAGRQLSEQEVLDGPYASYLRRINAGGGTSVFDPVLAELSYRWFCPPGGRVLDPFAGGSVRGIVAARLGRHYHGIELREEQVEANRRQCQQLVDADQYPVPEWTAADSRALLQQPHPSADFVLSCPPYANLEKYSDDPADVSNMKYADFLDAYWDIIDCTVATLADDRFIVWVVGDVRDQKTGIVRPFVSDTVRAFKDAGADMVNQTVVLQPIGSQHMTARSNFSARRAMPTVHQYALVFVKGDPRAAVENLQDEEADKSLAAAEQDDGEEDAGDDGLAADVTVSKVSS